MDKHRFWGMPLTSLSQQIRVSPGVGKIMLYLFVGFTNAVITGNKGKPPIYGITVKHGKGV
jgi:hypothetical protein